MTQNPTMQLPLLDTLTPADQNETAGVVRTAFAEKTPIYPLGGGTMLDRGACPQRPGLGISLAKLCNIVDYPADDMTITVQAGVTFERLAATLAENRQRLPVDVPLAARATIGGLLAVGHSGPRRFAYGTLRDYVLGLEAIDGQGNRFTAGGRVVKNAAGLNVHRLMVGALGTLGLITQVTLMVRPQPECSGFLLCDLPDWQQAEQLLAALVHSSTLPAAIELLAGANLEKGPLGQAGPGAVARLLVGFEGTEAEVHWMLDRLAAEWSAAGTAQARTISPVDAPALWQWLCDLPAEIELAVLPSRTTVAVCRLLEILPGAAVEAHAGNGIIRVGLPSQWQEQAGGARGGAGQQLSAGEAQQVSRGEPHKVSTGEPQQLSAGANQQVSADAGQQLSGIEPRAEQQPSAGWGSEDSAGQVGQHQTTQIAALACRKLRPAIAQLGGRVRILRTPPGANLTCEDVWGPLGKERVLMEEIKQRFDPAGILNPGRFIFP